jgi:hypothetical protein
MGRRPHCRWQDRRTGFIGAWSPWADVGGRRGVGRDVAGDHGAVGPFSVAGVRGRGRVVLGAWAPRRRSRLERGRAERGSAIGRADRAQGEHKYVTVFPLRELVGVRSAGRGSRGIQRASGELGFALIGRDPAARTRRASSHRGYPVAMGGLRVRARGERFLGHKPRRGARAADADSGVPGSVTLATGSLIDRKLPRESESL